MLDGGCDVKDETSTGLIPLHLACQGGSLGAVEALITAGSDVNKSGDDGKGYGARPVHIASDIGYPGVVEALAESGADLDVERNYQNRCAEKERKWRLLLLDFL